MYRLGAFIRGGRGDILSVGLVDDQDMFTRLFAVYWHDYDDPHTQELLGYGKVIVNRDLLVNSIFRRPFAKDKIDWQLCRYPTFSDTVLDCLDRGGVGLQIAAVYCNEEIPDDPLVTVYAIFRDNNLPNREEVSLRPLTVRKHYRNLWEIHGTLSAISALLIMYPVWSVDARDITSGDFIKKYAEPDGFIFADRQTALAAVKQLQSRRPMLEPRSAISPNVRKQSALNKLNLE